MPWRCFLCMLSVMTAAAIPQSPRVTRLLAGRGRDGPLAGGSDPALRTGEQTPLNSGGEGGGRSGPPLKVPAADRTSSGGLTEGSRNMPNAYEVDIFAVDMDNNATGSNETDVHEAHAGEAHHGLEDDGASSATARSTTSTTARSTTSTTARSTTSTTARSTTSTTARSTTSTSRSTPYNGYSEIEARFNMSKTDNNATNNSETENETGSRQAGTARTSTTDRGGMNHSKRDHNTTHPHGGAHFHAPHPPHPEVSSPAEGTNGQGSGGSPTRNSTDTKRKGITRLTVPALMTTPHRPRLPSIHGWHATNHRSKPVYDVPRDTNARTGSAGGANLAAKIAGACGASAFLLSLGFLIRRSRKKRGAGSSGGRMTGPTVSQVTRPSGGHGLRPSGSRVAQLSSVQGGRPVGRQRSALAVQTNNKVYCVCVSG